MYRKTPFVVGVAGGCCAGKSSTINKIVSALKSQMTNENLAEPRIAIIDIQLFRGKINQINKNPEHPAMVQDDTLTSCIKNIITESEGSVSLPDGSIINLPIDIVIIEGTLCFYFADIRRIIDLRLFVNCDPDIRLVRQVLRDVETGSLSDILQCYADSVKPAFEEYCVPTKKYAHIIIPRGCENTVAIDLIVQHLHEILILRSPRQITSCLSKSSSLNGIDTNSNEVVAYSPNQQLTQQQSNHNSNDCFLTDKLSAH